MVCCSQPQSEDAADNRVTPDSFLPRTFPAKIIIGDTFVIGDLRTYPWLCAIERSREERARNCANSEPNTRIRDQPLV